VVIAAVVVGVVVALVGPALLWHLEQLPHKLGKNINFEFPLTLFFLIFCCSSFEQKRSFIKILSLPPSLSLPIPLSLLAFPSAYSSDFYCRQRFAERFTHDSSFMLVST